MSSTDDTSHQPMPPPEAFQEPPAPPPPLIEIPEVAVQRGFWEVEGVISMFMVNCNAQLRELLDNYRGDKWADETMSEKRAVQALRAICMSEANQVIHFLHGLDNMHPRHKFARRLILMHQKNADACSPVQYVKLLTRLLMGCHEVMVLDPDLNSTAWKSHAAWKSAFDTAIEAMYRAIK